MLCPTFIPIYLGIVFNDTSILILDNDGEPAFSFFLSSPGVVLKYHAMSSSIIFVSTVKILDTPHENVSVAVTVAIIIIF